MDINSVWKEYKLKNITKNTLLKELQPRAQALPKCYTDTAFSFCFFSKLLEFFCIMSYYKTRV